MSVFFCPASEAKFIDHPVFAGVRLAKLVPREAGQPVGVLVLEIDPGVEIPVHTHDVNADSIYVAAGDGELFVDGRWRPVATGDYLLAPAGCEHGVRNTGSRPLRLFVHHSPPLM